MPLPDHDAKQRLERLIFDDDKPQDWVQDVWDMSPTLGETASKLSEVFAALVDCCPLEALDDLLKTYDQEKLK